MQGMRTEVTAIVTMRLKAFNEIRNVNVRIRMMREMRDMVALVMVKRSDLGVAAGRRGHIGAMSRVA